jgi:hypothetical protein
VIDTAKAGDKEEFNLLTRVGPHKEVRARMRVSQRRVWQSELNEMLYATLYSFKWRRAFYLYDPKFPAEFDPVCVAHYVY